MNSKDDNYDIIFVASITTKSGKKIYAAHYGKKAFPIKIKKQQ